MWFKGLGSLEFSWFVIIGYCLMWFRGLESLEFSWFKIVEYCMKDGENLFEIKVQIIQCYKKVNQINSMKQV